VYKTLEGNVVVPRDLWNKVLFAPRHFPFPPKPPTLAAFALDLETADPGDFLAMVADRTVRPKPRIDIGNKLLFVVQKQRRQRGFQVNMVVMPPDIADV
jgi:hypothetical protein